MKFFLPEWDDRVDPGYDFVTDRQSLDRDPYRDDLYAHELLPEPVYDGLLVSRMALEKSARKFERAQKIGMKAYLRMPSELELLGDCGAFGYVAQRDPTFTTEDVIDYYHRLGFDYGVSVDHIILPEFADQDDYRYQLTLKNAEDFLRTHRKGKFSFTPIGAVQGWNVPSYTESARKLVKMGYTYIAIGGLARSSTEEVRSVVSAVMHAVPADVRVHVFGVARASMLPTFIALGITSADSAAPLRQAWLAAKDNYYTIEGAFAAIRIPVAGDDRGRQATLVGRSDARYRMIRSAEAAALDSVRAYARRELPLSQALDAIVSYDALLADRVGERDARRRHELYRETLRARPWDHCRCPICRALGVETVIFRGNNRNRRRGFHNLWILRRRIEAALAGRPTQVRDATAE